jgi:outer membrane receptor protein involved in Fe transport
LSFQKWHGLSGGLRYRYLKSRPANEDNSIVDKNYVVSDMNLNYEYKSLTFGVSVANILNTKWNETQFATESRLKGEANSVEEIHFMVETAFYMKAKLTYKF